ncbi:MAG: response regulator [Alphaproteobacteria bacterium]
MPNSATVELPDLPSPPATRDGDHVLPAASPLRGITILAVEDSRFASEALRLMCRRLGVRLRRAETIQAARSHLALYRPDLIIVDLGLPDGRGETLIREMVAKGPAAPIILGTSGDADGRTSALAAGARGFLDKPLESFSAFHNLLLRHLPDEVPPIPKAQTTGNPSTLSPNAVIPYALAQCMLTPDILTPDHLALRDDFARAAALIETSILQGTEAETQVYLSAFLTGVARHADDVALAEAAERAGQLPTVNRLDQLRKLLAGRLAEPIAAFGRFDGE